MLRLWRGELPLARAFWRWAVAGGVVVNLATTVLLLVLVMQGQTAAGLVIGHGIALPYNLVAAVGVWRSAARYAGPPQLAQAARIAAVLGLSLLSLV
jgi:hypothetical protein